MQEICSHLAEFQTHTDPEVNLLVGKRRNHTKSQRKYAPDGLTYIYRLAGSCSQRLRTWNSGLVAPIPSGIAATSKSLHSPSHEEDACLCRMSRTFRLQHSQLQPSQSVLLGCFLILLSFSSPAQSLAAVPYFFLCLRADNESWSTTSGFGSFG